VPAIHSNSPLRDGEPKASATSLARLRFIEAIEAIEDFGLMFGRYPRPAVGYIDADAPLRFMLDPYRDHAAGQNRKCSESCKKRELPMVC